MLNPYSKDVGVKAARSLYFSITRLISYGRSFDQRRNACFGFKGGLAFVSNDRDKL